MGSLGVLRLAIDKSINCLQEQFYTFINELCVAVIFFCYAWPSMHFS